ncbi:TetR/AcrR family transcriptional regulator [Chitinasiproducens palmae]|uniref:DNA-binding transcriptional regulator, AcrR family n=1 Tax=Chitinasiproducens palmae TaxID=1770053 RepID=A0A1H2PNV3_9BURK|nr:TetR/AcrR family transcriptional regulator [Chitinasiproducens palmae]SDV48288.1 DNA-binding transcriptional regulator, AcrR family [Chitinasiproducens palmae]
MPNLSPPALPPTDERPRARRDARGSKSQQRVRDILRVGREVFVAKGFERATTTEIAQRLGISEGTIFSYFAGKRELCVRVIADWYDEIIAEIEQGLPAGGVRAQFEFIVRAHLRLFLLHGTGMSALVLSEGRAKHHALVATLIEQQRRYTAPMMAVLARGQAQGEIRRDVPLRLLRSMVFGPMEHILWDAALSDHPVDLAAIDATAEKLVEMLWRTLSPDVAPARAAALAAFHADVAQALHRLQAALPDAS